MTRRAPRSSNRAADDPLAGLSHPATRDWFRATFPQGPTPPQRLTWPVVAQHRHALVLAPTGTGKTLSAFLGVLDRLANHARPPEPVADGLRCVYVSPLRSLGYDVERNLQAPLEGLARRLGYDRPDQFLRVATRTSDTTAHQRRKLRDRPPHLLVTTPESLALMLSQADWRDHFAAVETIIVDEIHALAPTKRGVDLMLSLERLADLATTDPTRIGLSATCRPAQRIARYLVGPTRGCVVLDAWNPVRDDPQTDSNLAPDPQTPVAAAAQTELNNAIVQANSSIRLPDRTPELRVVNLLRADEGFHRGLSYRRLLARLEQEIRANRSTVIFANTRAFAERLTHDLRARFHSNVPTPYIGNAGDLIGNRLCDHQVASRVQLNARLKIEHSRLVRAVSAPPQGHPGDLVADKVTELVAVHHSALDATRRREVEHRLKTGQLRAVVTSTSLELGVDLGTADLTVLVGPPDSVQRCLQRVGRAGHSIEATPRGLIVTVGPAELLSALVTARAAREGRIEPIAVPRVPLDVVCQHLVGMACAGEWEVERAYELIRRADPTSTLSREDFLDCLSYLAGESSAPASAFEPEPGANPRWSGPRIWKAHGSFGAKSGRILRWFRMNVGTIHAEETIRVLVDGVELGTLEAVYAERLSRGDRFVLDGRALEVVRGEEGGILLARATGGEPNLPRWTSDRLSLSRQLAKEVFATRVQVRDLLRGSPDDLAQWLRAEFQHDEPDAVETLRALIEAQERCSVVPESDSVLIEDGPLEDWSGELTNSGSGRLWVFHAPLGRAACETLGRAVAARWGRRLRRDLGLTAADLGWALRVPAALPPDEDPPEPDWNELLDPEGLEQAVLTGLDRGELVAQRFRHAAAVGLMILKRHESQTRNTRGGGSVRVGGTRWAATKLYPVVKAAAPRHPLIREAQREALEEVLDLPTARAWLEQRPRVMRRTLQHQPLSPFAAAWIEPGGGLNPPGETLRFESPASALKRLHERLTRPRVQT
ncbi:DEAD/DEAH box helicase domain protein [Isosphaera pallida ATCC 43644]|uniref:DEAD/DEAH box helicase domain protein n=1 Tax=Isosphaera pallida (strain ATCC 43644 / DSM 9630 / IS1B) TaxID=575540 RepID=E8R183_ISOPI|nr:DEAD/DEAH box helicase [Isosphaera pallida]ADV61289.1 DEAD/DEAH box helicase domain protein [Isosphaera pallida ATCC 43644]